MALQIPMRRRALADALQVALTRLKRDLKNGGMTEAQIHEIIPDVPSSADSAAAPGPAPQKAADA